MHNVSIAVAEHVLRFLTTKEGACSIVGDLVETARQKGAAWFWLSIFKIAFWLGWRPLAAFVAAFYCGNWALGGLQLAMYGANAHRVPLPWMPVFGVLLGSTVVLCMAISYAVIRYGVRDNMTQLGLLWTGIFTLILFEWWRPGVLAICIVLTVSLIGASLHKRERHRASVAIFATVVIGLASGMAAMYLAGRWQHFIYPGPWGDADVRAHPSVLWIAALTYLTTVGISTAVLSRLHKWALERTV